MRTPLRPLVAFGLVFGLCAACALTSLAQTAPPPRLEAQRRADALFETFRARCGTDYVVAIDVTPPSGGATTGGVTGGGFTQTLGQAPARASGHTIYVAYADVRLDGRETTKDIDRRNGIVWAGTLTVSAAAARQISVGKDGTVGKWTPGRRPDRSMR